MGIGYTCTISIKLKLGDFHFLWENQYFNPFGEILGCLVLSNLRQCYIERLGVDQKGKVFSIGDEFILHAFLKSSRHLHT